MQKRIFLSVLVAFFALMMFSCEEETFFDAELLHGKWKSGTLYYRYFSDGKGYTWDTSDDVNEDEAQRFTWTLVRLELTHIHVLEIGGTVPKVYTVKELTTSRLRYEDDFGKSYTFTKVTE